MIRLVFDVYAVIAAAYIAIGFIAGMRSSGNNGGKKAKLGMACVVSMTWGFLLVIECQDLYTSSRPESAWKAWRQAWHKVF